MKRVTFLLVAVLLQAASNDTRCQDLKLNDLEYFETQGVNVLVYNNLFTGPLRVVPDLISSFYPRNIGQRPT